MQFNILASKAIRVFIVIAAVLSRRRYSTIFILLTVFICILALVWLFQHGNEAEINKSTLLLISSPTLRVKSSSAPALQLKISTEPITMASSRYASDGSPNAPTLQQTISKSMDSGRYSSSITNRFPRIMIIGFGKAGTKALYEVLKLHPSLNGPGKESRFFSRHYSDGIASYLKSMPQPPAGGFVIEKSPDYVVSHVEERIVQTCDILGINSSTLKFVVILRDPLDRSVSDYLEWIVQSKLQGQKQFPSFQEKTIGVNGDVIKTALITNSYYSVHIKEWLETFSWNQLCIVDGGLFTADPYSEVVRLEACLGLPSYFKKDNFAFNKKRGFYCFSKGKKTLCMNKTKGRPHPDLPPDVISRLRTHFSPYDDDLYQLTKRNFSWMH